MNGTVWDTNNHRGASDFITVLGGKAIIRSTHMIREGDIIREGPIQYRITSIHKYKTHREATLECLHRED